MSVIVDIKTLLTAIETYIYLGDYPDTPDNLLVIYETSGRDPDKCMDGGKYEKPSFQVYVRNTSYATGISNCEAIKDVLSLISNTTINDNFYLSIRQRGDIMRLGKDYKNRVEFTLNFDCEIIR